VLKLAGIAILVASVIFATRSAPVAAAPAPFGFRQFGIAMIACLWAYEGWYCISFVAGEVKNPQRNIPSLSGSASPPSLRFT
jgi:APA family basic amino acid/polyamine antiporter